jgi:hypothetical protein
MTKIKSKNENTDSKEAIIELSKFLEGNKDITISAVRRAIKDMQELIEIKKYVELSDDDLNSLAIEFYTFDSQSFQRIHFMRGYEECQSRLFEKLKIN